MKNSKTCYAINTVLTGCCSRPFPSCTCCPTHLWQWRSSSVSQQSVASKSTSSQHTLFYLHRIKLSVPPCPVIVAEPGWVILSNSYLRNLLLDCWLLTGERVFRQIQGESRLSSFLGTRSVALCCTPPPSPVPPHLRCGAKGLHCTHSSTTDRGGKKRQHWVRGCERILEQSRAARLWRIPGSSM